ncbi:putative phosphomannomutase [Dirofilaria immitis]
MYNSAEDLQNLKTTEKVEQAGKINGEEQTHCLCGSSDESSFMICCDHCGIWYHGACLQVTRTQANRIETYACPPCISKNNNLKIVYRVPKKEQEKSVHREKRCKSRSARNDIKTRNGPRHSSKDDHEESKTGGRCNNCINCFRSVDCGKCANCNISVEPCLKRICLQSEWWNKHKKKQPKIAGRDESVLSNIYSVPTRSKKERMKFSYTTDDDDDDNTETLKQESGSIRSGFAASGAKKTQRKLRKKKTIAYQKRQPNSGTGRTKKSKTSDFSFTTEQRQKIASAIYNRRSNRYNLNKEKVKHCEGPQCTNSTRSESKFCCEECGMNLARNRLRAILPDRVQVYWDNISHFMEQSRHLRDAAEEQIQFYTNKVRIFADFQDELQKWISTIEKIESENETAINNSLDMDFVLHCAVCALEFPAKLIVKHMERCFVRNEKQSCYGTPNKSQVNPYNIFCEQFNKANSTFCKRLRVLCSEHYKSTEDTAKVCGYPFAWNKSQFRPVIKTFNDMHALLQEGFCHYPRKNCLQHHNWVQNAMGLIDVELLNLLIKLDEWFEKKRTLQVSETMRGDVLSLFCDKTVRFNRLNEDRSIPINTSIISISRHILFVRQLSKNLSKNFTSILMRFLMEFHFVEFVGCYLMLVLYALSVIPDAPFVLLLRGIESVFGSLSVCKKMSGSNGSKMATILLFDVDGTLTLPRQKMDQAMSNFMMEVHKTVPLAVVSGSDLSKIVEQLGESLEDVLNRFDYVFSENGLVSISEDTTFPVQSIKHHLGETRLKKLINFTLREFAKIDLPVKRGNFIELRNGMLNLSPIGRSCTQEERMQFTAYDKEHGVRQKFVKKLKDFTEGWNLNICIGGQISVDVFPYGWDKTYCLQFLDSFHTIHFFGDKTSPDGNDYHLFTDPRTIGYTVKDPKDTMKQVRKLLEIP